VPGTRPSEHVGHVSSGVTIVVYELFIADCGMVLKPAPTGCRGVGVPLPVANVGKSRPRCAVLACADRSGAGDHLRFPSFSGLTVRVRFSSPAPLSLR
jgi:hypothetical protein